MRSLMATQFARRLGIVGALTCSSAIAQNSPAYYGYHDMSPLYLGAGLTPPNLTAVKVPCMTGTAADADGEASGSGEVRTMIVSRANQVRQTLGVDSKIDASYLAYKGSASFNFDQNTTFDESSITVVMYAANTFSSKVLKAPALTDSAKALLKAGLVNDFISQCGSQYVSVERRGVMIGVVLTIHNISETSRKSIKASVSGSGGWGPLSASASANFKDELNKASSESRVDSNIVYLGGAGTAALDSYVKAALSGNVTMDAISTGIANYVKTMSAANAAPLGYFVTDMPGLAAAANAPWTDLKQRRLEDIVAAYRKAANAVAQIGALADGSDARAGVIPKAQIDALVNQVPLLQAQQTVLSVAHSACIADIDPAVPKCAAPIDSGFDWSLMPYPIQTPSATIRIVAGPDEYQGTLLSKADSEAVLGSLIKQPDTDLGDRALNPKTLLLSRTSSTVLGAKVAWKTLLISSPYLDSMSIYIEPTGAFRQKFIDAQPRYLTATPIGRVTLPGYAERQARQTEYEHNGAMFASSDIPVYLEQDPWTITEPQDVKQLYFEMQAFVAGASGTTKAAAGTADFVVEVRDVFGSQIKFRPYQLSWSYDKTTHDGQILITHLGNETNDVLAFHVVTKSECLQKNPGLDFICNGMPD